MANNKLPRRIIKETRLLLSEPAKGGKGNYGKGSQLAAFYYGITPMSLNDSFSDSKWLQEFSIQALLNAPNPDDPLSENIAKHWKTDEAEAVETDE